MQKGLLVVVSGPAGVGKGMITHALAENYPDEFVLSVSVTTRKPRYNETEGVSYFFISEEEFENKVKNGELLEYNRYVGNGYGTLKSFVESRMREGINVILEIDTNGGFQIKEKMPNAILVFVCPPSFEELEARLRGRGTETEEVIQKRLEVAKSEFKKIPRYDYAVINKDGCWLEAAETIRNIVASEKHSVKNSRDNRDILNLINIK